MYGLALAGGGSRGSYELGVYKALLELEIPIGAIIGTSIGAINAAAFLMDDLDKFEKIWKNADKDSIIDVKDIDLQKIIKQRGFDNKSIMNLLKEVLDEKTIRDNPIDLGIVTYNVSKLEPVVLFKENIPEGYLIDYIAASANHPTLERLKIDGDKFIDGAVYDNIPVKPLFEKGYEDIIAVDLGTITTRFRDITGPFNLIEIKHNGDLGSTLFPDPRTNKRNIEFGYLDTLKAFGKIHGHFYYFENLNFGPLLNSPTAKEIAKIENSSSTLFINRTLEPYKVNLGESYSLSIAALEITSEFIGIDNVSIFKNPNELLNLVLESINPKNVKNGYKNVKNFVLTKNLNTSAIEALSIANPKAAIANIFLKVIQKRLLGV
ncbi:MAG: patatin-like phospholipase family protein [Clostridium sp.]|nr:patatin-like phospholipase family protein [Clostridium sp.]